MSILAALLRSLILPVALFLHYYALLIVAAVILSWLEAFRVLNSYNRFVALVCSTLHRLTDPYFNFFRRFLPSTGSIDFSPLIGLFALFFLQGFVPQVLAILANAIA